MPAESGWHGILPVYKPTGLTSHDVVAQVRRLFKQKRVGHAGTLDPGVDGLLLLCLGKATRLVEYLQSGSKVYEGQFTCGFSTNTQDSSGRFVEARLPVDLAEPKIAAAMADFVGEIEQVPPMYSAVKKNGQRLYELARQGKEVERKSRKQTIRRFSLLSSQRLGMLLQVDFVVECSKGTYIRTLCHDVGSRLGYPAHLSRLTRVASGSFTLADAYTLQQLSALAQRGGLVQALQPLKAGVTHLPCLQLSAELIRRVQYGQRLAGSDLPLGRAEGSEGLVALLDTEGELAAVYRMEEQEGRWQWRPEKVLLG